MWPLVFLQVLGVPNVLAVCSPGFVLEDPAATMWRETVAKPLVRSARFSTQIPEHPRVSHCPTPISPHAED